MNRPHSDRRNLHGPLCKSALVAYLTEQLDWFGRCVERSCADYRCGDDDYDDDGGDGDFCWLMPVDCVVDTISCI